MAIIADGMRRMAEAARLTERAVFESLYEQAVGMAALVTPRLYRVRYTPRPRWRFGIDYFSAVMHQHSAAAWASVAARGKTRRRP